MKSGRAPVGGATAEGGGDCVLLTLEGLGGLELGLASLEGGEEVLGGLQLGLTAGLLGVEDSLKGLNSLDELVQLVLVGASFGLFDCVPDVIELEDECVEVVLAHANCDLLSTNLATEVGDGNEARDDSGSFVV